MRKAIYAVGGIFLLLVFVVVFFRTDSENLEEVPISRVLFEIRSGSVVGIEVKGQDLDVTYITGEVRKAAWKAESAFSRFLT